MFFRGRLFYIIFGLGEPSGKSRKGLCQRSRHPLIFHLLYYCSGKSLFVFAHPLILLSSFLHKQSSRFHIASTALAFILLKRISFKINSPINSSNLLFEGGFCYVIFFAFDDIRQFFYGKNSAITD